ncbi:MAG TPA: hypothetical protein PLB05_07050 [Candidatus Omnitrophota bacterium]|nr:hypothetical protein [Candidatus Omnitrophota bacterium]HPN56056.1 hypothetical protein [Candidatus Omnitrophota bacterium]
MKEIVSGLKMLAGVSLLAMALVFGNSSAVAAQGFLYSVTILDQQAVRALSDEKLLEIYVDVLVDLEASTAFSRTAGFNKNEYIKFKELIYFRVRLFNEIKRRRLEVPETGSPCYS